MWANAQRDGRPAEYSWRPLLNAAVWLTPTTRVPCSNAAKTRNPLKLAGVPQTNVTISAATLPLYPGLGQALNMLACIPSGVVHWRGSNRVAWFIPSGVAFPGRQGGR